MKLRWFPRSPHARKGMSAAHELFLIDRINLARIGTTMSTSNLAIMADKPLNRNPPLAPSSRDVLIDA